MTLGYHAPLPPAPTGVAEYARDLLDALQRTQAQDTVVVGAGNAGVQLCQLGNNPLHKPAHEALERASGRKLVLLHDANLHHYYLGIRGRDAYVNEFCAQYGEWHRGFAEQLWQERARSGSDPRYFEYAMLAGVASRAGAIVVHNPEARRRVLAQAPNAEVHIVPHYFRRAHEPEPWRILDLRASLGLTGTDTLFAVFGHLRESKRVIPILRAFARARARNPRIYLLIVGEPVSAEYARTLEFAADQQGVIRRGYLPEAEFWLYAHAVDACINLRYPSCGESSGIAVKLMGLGKPVLLTGGESEFPPGSFVPVDAGPAEEEMVAEWMLLLAADRRLRDRIGWNAANHVAKHHGLDGVAQRIWGIARSLQAAAVGRQK
ncbi:MAG: glycosyltransferase [Bryobacterales bacterium]|nr:glycosyltransferase [Bryobacterales bacterium]